MVEKIERPAPNALEVFLSSVESRTDNTTHLRLLRAARKPNPPAALVREMEKIMEELLRED